jgi:hypothetical protein
MLKKRYGTQKCPGRKVGKSSSKPMFCGFHPSFGEISVFFSFDRICFLGPTSFRGTYLGAHEEQRPPQHPNGVPWEGQLLPQLLPWARYYWKLQQLDAQEE